MFQKIVLFSLVFIYLAAPGVGSGRGDGPYIFLPDGGNMMVYSSGDSYRIVDRNKLLNNDIQRNISRLASGLRIVTAADDPSGLAVAEKMKALILDISRRSLNDEDMRSYLNYMESQLGHDTALLQRMRELALQASNGILGEDDREVIQEEVAQLVREMDATAGNSEFNRKKVMPAMTARYLGVGDLDVVKNPQAAISAIDAASEKIVRLRALSGTRANMLEFRIKGRNYYYINLQQAESSIRDLDMAEEVSSLMKNYTLLKSEQGVIVMRKVLNR